MASLAPTLSSSFAAQARPLAVWSLLALGAGAAIQQFVAAPAFALVLAAAVTIGFGVLRYREGSEVLQRLVLAGCAAGLAAFAADWFPGLAAVCWGSGVAVALTRYTDVSRLGVRALAGGWGALAGSFAAAGVGLGAQDPAVAGLLVGVVGAEVALAVRMPRRTPLREARALRNASELTRPLLDAGLADYERAAAAGAEHEAERLLSELVRACGEAERHGSSAADADPGEALRGFTELAAARRQAQEEFLNQQAEALAAAERAAVDLALLSAPGSTRSVPVRVEACQ